jgi:hypothetical protein
MQPQQPDLSPRRPTMQPAPSADTPPPLRPLALLVVKQGVGLGGLPTAQLTLALAFVWAGLPQDTRNEAGINQALKAQLAGPAAFLDTDHVELRRWLVDIGCLQRDGYGRAYQRVPLEHLPEGLKPQARLLQDLDTEAWAQAQREKQAFARRARRAAWEGRAPENGA